MQQRLLDLIDANDNEGLNAQLDKIDNKAPASSLTPDGNSILKSAIDANLEIKLFTKLVGKLADKDRGFKEVTGEDTPDWSYASYHSVLHYIIEKKPQGSVDYVTVLLEAGCSPEFATQTLDKPLGSGDAKFIDAKITALEMSCRCGNAPIAALFLKRGAIFNDDCLGSVRLLCQLQSPDKQPYYEKLIKFLQEFKQLLTEMNLFATQQFPYKNWTQFSLIFIHKLMKKIMDNQRHQFALLSAFLIADKDFTPDTTITSLAVDLFKQHQLLQPTKKTSQLTFMTFFYLLRRGMPVTASLVETFMGAEKALAKNISSLVIEHNTYFDFFFKLGKVLSSLMSSHSKNLSHEFRHLIDSADAVQRALRANYDEQSMIEETTLDHVCRELPAMRFDLWDMLGNIVFCLLGGQKTENLKSILYQKNSEYYALLQTKLMSRALSHSPSQSIQKLMPKNPDHKMEVKEGKQVSNSTLITYFLMEISRKIADFTNPNILCDVLQLLVIPYQEKFAIVPAHFVVIAHKLSQITSNIYPLHILDSVLKLIPLIVPENLAFLSCKDAKDSTPTPVDSLDEDETLQISSQDLTQLTEEINKTIKISQGRSGSKLFLSHLTNSLTLKDFSHLAHLPAGDPATHLSLLIHAVGLLEKEKAENLKLKAQIKLLDEKNLSNKSPDEHKSPPMTPSSGLSGANHSLTDKISEPTPASPPPSVTSSSSLVIPSALLSSLSRNKPVEDSVASTPSVTYD